MFNLNMDIFPDKADEPAAFQTAQAISERKEKEGTIIIPSTETISIHALNTSDDTEIISPLQQRQAKSQATVTELKEAIKALGYSATYNDWYKQGELSLQGLPCDPNEEVHTIYRKLDDLGYKPTDKRLEHALGDLRNENKYHPLKDYLLNAGAFYQDNGNGTDYIDMLSGFIQTNDISNAGASADFFPPLLRKWIVGAVGKALDGFDNQLMLLFCGKQGIGKSRLASWLSPRPEWFCSTFLNFSMDDERHDAEVLTRNFIVELGEISMKGKAIDGLKHRLSQTVMEPRLAYRKDPIKLQVTASVIGTFNPIEGLGFFKDVTGNRRYLLFDLEHIDWNYSKINKELLWGQAVTIWQQQGESAALLLASEKEYQEGVNEAFIQGSDLEDAIVSLFDIDPSRRDWYVPVDDVRQTLKLQGAISDKDNTKPKRLATLQKLGVKHDPKKDIRKIDGHSVRVYFGIKKKENL